MLTKWCHWESNSISVFIFGFAFSTYIKFKQKIAIESSTALLLNFMLNTLNSENNTNKTMYIIKNPVPY